MAPTTFHLIRHAAHGLLPHTLAGRMPGVPLSAEGVAQAERLAERLSGTALAAVVASPVQRAQETAAPIAARHGLAVQTEPGFDEIDFGRWTGQRFEALEPDGDWQRWNRQRALAACPGGETMHAAQSRALLAMERWHARHQGAAVAVVSHADVLKAVLAAVLGLGLDNLQRFELAPGSCSVVRWSEWGAVVEAVNLPA